MNHIDNINNINITKLSQLPFSHYYSVKHLGSFNCPPVTTSTLSMLLGNQLTYCCQSQEYLSHLLSLYCIPLDNCHYNHNINRGILNPHSNIGSETDDVTVYMSVTPSIFTSGKHWCLITPWEQCLFSRLAQATPASHVLQVIFYPTVGIIGIYSTTFIPPNYLHSVCVVK